MSRNKKAGFGSEEAGEIDLKPFINFLMVLVPVLMLSADYGSISLIKLKLPEGRGSQVNEGSKQQSLKDESDKLLLTMIISDSVVTLGAKGGFLPSMWYKEYHKYLSRTNRNISQTAQYDPKNPKAFPINPETGKQFELNERSEILLWVADEAGNTVKCLYSKDGNMVTDENGLSLTTVTAGQTVYIVRNPRTSMVVQDPSVFKLQELSAYDEMKNRLLKVKERYPDASDANDIIIAAENQVAYDKIVQLMDIARSADFPNIAIAKLRS